MFDSEEAASINAVVTILNDDYPDAVREALESGYGNPYFTGVSLRDLLCDLFCDDAIEALAYFAICAIDAEALGEALIGGPVPVE